MNRNYCAVSWLALLVAMLVTGKARAAEDYKGADAILTQMTGTSGAPATGAVAPAAQWLADVDAFRTKASSLAPDDAARQWLGLADRYAAFTGADFVSLTASDRARMMSGYFGGRAGEILKALPGPAAWPALAKMIDKRPAQSEVRNAAFEAALSLLGHTLIADAVGQEKAVQALADVKDSSLHDRIDIPALEDALANESDDPAAVASGFKKKMEGREKMVAESSATRQFEYNGNRFAVPDLVTILGAKDAEPLLKEAVLLPQTELNIAGTETSAMARRVALEEVANMKTPHWELAASLNGAALYEALEKRFPDASLEANSSGDYDTAREYYFLHLIVTAQTDKAIALADSLPTDNSASIPVDELDNAGYTKQVADFLHDLLAKHPELPLWDDYINLSAKTGQTSEMLALIRSMASRTDLSTPQRGNVHKSFYLALLAADQIDEGIAELRKVISEEESSSSSDSNSRDDSASEKYVALARLGQLLGRQDLLDEGIAGAKKHLLKDPNTNWDADTVGSLAELLVEIGRGPEAEDLLGQVIPRIQSGYGISMQKRECLADLVRVYFKAGRADDVLSVLDKYPGWGVADLKDILTQQTEGFTIAEYSTHAAADNYPIGYMAAWALAQNGHTGAALTILNALLDEEGGFDPGYELLTKLSGQDAIPRLDELARMDRFQTRPLIWKAQLQLDAGNLDDAEKTVRAAITIDPSDGEQGPGRRMREYAVLADVLDKKGDKEHADTYRGAVTAIRMSEHADRFYEAGLLTRAVAMYKDALTHFADAYCIQSRLALRLAELGDNAGAEEHYRRAYELMPESFGRVESHCFGCERAFEGIMAQSIAEKVFTQLAVKMPTKPQVHYLLGYLRTEQGRYREALPEFEEAVKLDPDYLNAWKEIGGLAENMHLPEKLRNEVVLNQVRLDPLQRHGRAQATYVTDLAGLWNAIAAAESLQPPAPGPLLPLTASAAEITKPKPAANASANGHPVASALSVISNVFFGSSSSVDVSEPFDSEEIMEAYSKSYNDPASVIANNCFIAAVSQVFGKMPNWSLEE